MSIKYGTLHNVFHFTPFHTKMKNLDQKWNLSWRVLSWYKHIIFLYLDNQRCLNENKLCDFNDDNGNWTSKSNIYIVITFYFTFYGWINICQGDVNDTFQGTSNRASLILHFLVKINWYKICSKIPIRLTMLLLSLN